jgi:hypothetical protein
MGDGVAAAEGEGLMWCSRGFLPQGVPYLLAEPSKDLADARLWRSPTTEHTAEIGRRLLLYRGLQQPVLEGAAGVLQGAWRRFVQRRRGGGGGGGGAPEQGGRGSDA